MWPDNIRDRTALRARQTRKILKTISDRIKVEQAEYKALTLIVGHRIQWRRGRYSQEGTVQMIIGLPGTARFRVLNERTNKTVDISPYDVDWEVVGMMEVEQGW